MLKAIQVLEPDLAHILQSAQRSSHVAAQVAQAAIKRVPVAVNLDGCETRERAREDSEAVCGGGVSPCPDILGTRIDERQRKAVCAAASGKDLVGELRGVSRLGQKPESRRVPVRRRDQCVTTAAEGQHADHPLSPARDEDVQSSGPERSPPRGDPPWPQVRRCCDPVRERVPFQSDRLDRPGHLDLWATRRY